MADQPQTEDVPAPIDFRVPERAREWAGSAMARRPYRLAFFRAIADELVPGGQILELGSGPAFLAEHLLRHCRIGRYVALDFSDAMHVLAKERLGALPAGIEFIVRDFRQPGWNHGLRDFDAIVSMQAVHEVRHKRHTGPLYAAVCEMLRSGGSFLVCDLFAGEEMTDTELFMTPAEHEQALRDAGFAAVRLLRQEGALVLFRGTAGAVRESVEPGS